jgi:hypothetical protein
LPEFLENALRHEARKRGMTGEHADHFVYGTMNHIGAIRGNVETPKGKQIEREHITKRLAKKPSA